MKFIPKENEVGAAFKTSIWVVRDANEILGEIAVKEHVWESEGDKVGVHWTFLWCKQQIK